MRTWGKNAEGPCLWLCIALALMIAAVYSGVSGHDFIRKFDDAFYILENETVRSGLSWPGFAWAFTTTHAANWHPLTWLSHMLDVELFGLEPAGHHWVSLVIHIVNAILLFLLLRKMTGATLRSFAVAALFAVHPLNVESVAWVAERKNVLSTLFGFAALWAYARYVEKPELGRYAAVMAAFALSLLAKPMWVTLPFLLLLLDYWPLERLALPGAEPTTAPVERPRIPIGQAVMEKVPLFGLMVLSCIVTFIAQSKGGAVGTLMTYPFWARVGNALVSYAFYLEKMVWPQPLAILYPHLGVELAVWKITLSGALLAGLTAAALWGARKERFWAVGWFWYLGTLVPVIGLVQVGVQAAADRYAYIPLIGVFLALVWGEAEAIRSWRHARWFATVALAAAILALAAVSVAQVRIWRDGEALFQHALAVTAGNWRAHHQLADILTDQGHLTRAEAHYREALSLEPDFAHSRANLAFVLLRKNKLSEAVEQYTMALSLNPFEPSFHNGLGGTLAKMGRLKEAEGHFLEALRIDPHYAPARSNLARAQGMQAQ